MKKVVFAISIALLLLALVPAQALADPPPDYFVAEEKLPFDPLPGLPTDRYWGVHQGAGYRIEVPLNWNGALVLWAHEYRESPGILLELTVDNHPLRPWLIANGYAWAASSYSRNNYDVTAGAQDTHALPALFKRIVDKPHRIYLSGASMGGHVVATMVEQWPNSYDGALSLCGNLGDYALFDYHLDFNLVAQALVFGEYATYPLPDDFLTNPNTGVPYIKEALTGDPAMPFPFSLNDEGKALAAATLWRSGGPRPIFEQGFLFWNAIPGDFLFGVGTRDDILTRVRGVAVDNAETVYQLDADPALSLPEEWLNAVVLRVSRDPQARHPNGLANVPPLNGKIKIPVLTLHNLGDLYVPISMEQIYAQRVAANNASHLLVQRAIRDVTHCGFTDVEAITAFVDLVTWVETGVQPVGDNLLDPVAMAQPDFGCAFTSEDRVISVPGLPQPVPLPPCPSESVQAAGGPGATQNLFLPATMR